jgi:hypothetical protein
MPSVWVPDPELRAHRNETSDVPETELGAACVLSTLLDFEPERWGLPAYALHAS